MIKLCPKAYQKYLSLPLLGSVLDDFSVWSHQRGYSIVTVRCQLKHALRIEDFFREHNVKSLTSLTRSAFKTAWNYYRHRSPMPGTTIVTVVPALQGQSTRWNYFLKRLTGCLPIYRG
jgi:hypothetical protein